jgi:GNAT superfamily N-acetyltransferase
MQTRPIQPDDLDAIREMIGDLAAFHGDSPIALSTEAARDLVGPAPWFTVIMAEDQCALVGYAAMLPLGQLQFGLRGMDIHHMFVRQTMRGQGVGHMLIRTCLDHAAGLGCGFVTVGTHPDNHAAAAFYAYEGFIKRPEGGPRFSIKL